MLVQQSGWATGRVRRQDTGTSKREEPIGICDVELSVPKWSNLKISLCIIQPEVVAVLVGIC